MYTAGQILKRKGSEVLTIGPEQTVHDAIKLMAERTVGALVVTEGDKPVGIFSERDYLRRVILQGRASPTTEVRQIMTSPVISASPDWAVEQCMVTMTERRIRHLPVTEDGRLVGIISIGDVVKSVIEDKNFVIDQLKTYMQVEV